MQVLKGVAKQYENNFNFISLNISDNRKKKGFDFYTTLNHSTLADNFKTKFTAVHILFC